MPPRHLLQQGCCCDRQAHQIGGICLAHRWWCKVVGVTVKIDFPYQITAVDDLQAAADTGCHIAGMADEVGKTFVLAGAVNPAELFVGGVEGLNQER